jgi:mannitol/fructose-specific phosphotransferase system IIA component (Ntr-type)
LGEKMKFADFVCFEAIIPELSSTVRDSAIAELVSALSKAGRLKRSQCEGIIKAVIKRENEASTGMGKGVAVPHVKDGSLKEVVAAVGRSSVGIKFASLDKQPVYSVILLLSPADKPDKHLQAMEMVFKNLQNEQFRKFLRQSQSAAEIRDLLREADEEPFFLRV